MMERRQFVGGALASAAGLTAARAASNHGKVTRVQGSRITLGLNLYSFNQPLRQGSTTIAEVIDFCALHGLNALDATGYYFPGYPKVAPDEYLYELKRRAFVNGVTISGTGVRNDFTVADEAKRAGDVQLVKDWIDVGSKLGSTVIRVFAGSRVPDAKSFERALEWMVPALKECAAYGRRRGVIVGVQNHDDFLRTADETIRLVEAVNSEWLGVVLDVGSLRQAEPYAEIEKLVPYAVSWQLKESVWHGSRETPIDLRRLKGIIDKTGYRGFLPIETLGEGDPRVKVPNFLRRVREVFG